MRMTTDPGIGTEDGVTEVDPVFITEETIDQGSDRAPGHHGHHGHHGHKAYPPPPPSVRNKRGMTDWRKLEMPTDPIFAKDLMSRNLLTIGPNDVLERLEEQMQAFRFRHLPVVED